MTDTNKVMRSNPAHEQFLLPNLKIFYDLI